MRPSFGPNPHKGRLRCPTNCDAHLPESNFQTHSRFPKNHKNLSGIFLQHVVDVRRYMRNDREKDGIYQSNALIWPFADWVNPRKRGCEKSRGCLRETDGRSCKSLIFKTAGQTFFTAPFFTAEPDRLFCEKTQVPACTQLAFVV